MSIERSSHLDFTPLQSLTIELSDIFPERVPFSQADITRVIQESKDPEVQVLKAKMRPVDDIIKDMVRQNLLEEPVPGTYIMGPTPKE